MVACACRSLSPTSPAPCSFRKPRGGGGGGGGERSVGSSVLPSGVYALSGFVVRRVCVVYLEFFFVRVFHPASCSCFTEPGWACWSTFLTLRLRCPSVLCVCYFVVLED